ncbi:MAG: hypothetical protein JXQ73_13995 [Phycisphaerae bacterium]|nr:hypothetical protein [Phycisphaerae bacterium]
MKASLPCPACGREFSAQAILDASDVSWPDLCWIHFTCPSCGTKTHIQVQDGQMATVDFLGAPGPEWEINTVMHVPDLTVRMDPGLAHVWLNGVHHEFKAQQ